MLIDKGFTKNDVVSIKLITGEEVVAVFENYEGDLVVTKPAHFLPHGDQVHFPPYLMTSGATKYTFPADKIVVVCKTQDEIAKMYTEQTTSIQMV